jgi:hypothetical protein
MRFPLRGWRAKYKQMKMYIEILIKQEKEKKEKRKERYEL